METPETLLQKAIEAEQYSKTLTRKRDKSGAYAMLQLSLSYLEEAQDLEAKQNAKHR